MQKNLNNFLIFNILDLIEEIGEERLQTILSDFSCPPNKEVEYFLHRKAIEFAKDGVSVTYLVFLDSDDTMDLVGYFTINIKNFEIDTRKLSRTLKKSILHFAGYKNDGDKKIMLPAHLIAQLGKNYTQCRNKLIKGDDLMFMAIKKVEDSQRGIGGRLCYLECENKNILMAFYQQHGFVEFNRRKLTEAELKRSTTDEYVQMLRYRKIPKKVSTIKIVTK